MDAKCIEVEERVEMICLTDDSIMLFASSISAIYSPIGSLPSKSCEAMASEEVALELK